MAIPACQEIFRPATAVYFAFFREALVLDAFFAAAERLAALLFPAADLDWRESAVVDAEETGSFFNALTLARDLVRDTGFPFCACSESCAAFFRIFPEPLPFRGGGSFTPARRASDKPMAIACFAERAPCSPLRILLISSCTNSPAWVLADFPSCLSSRALRIVFLSGIKKF
jgi:hypothetical protein